MQGKPDNNAAAQPPKPVLDKHKLYALKQQLVDLSSLEPQARGYAFENWLKELFNTYGLRAQNPFRLIGEQIDGSFVLQGETYLVEVSGAGAHVKTILASANRVNEKHTTSRLLTRLRVSSL